MTERIWTRGQYGKLSELQKKYLMPDKVVMDIHRAVDILDRYYGTDRDVDRDDGGYILLILSESENELDLLYKEVMEKYHLRVDDAEFNDIIYDDGIVQWHSDVFIVSNDYGITIVYSVG